MQSGTSTKSARSIADFWAWWIKRGQSDCVIAQGSGKPEKFARELTKRVKSIDPGLAWEFGTGANSTWQLCLTSGGQRELRVISQRWKDAAPATTESWEFLPAKPRDTASMKHILQFGGWDLDLSLMEFDAVPRDHANLIDITVFHPTFANLEHDVRIQISFLALDWTLGEDDFERWIGDVHETTSRSEAGLDAAGLAKSVDAFATRPMTGEFELLGVIDQGDRVGSVTRVARIKWLDYPTRDLHNEISGAFEDSVENSLDALQDLETDLRETLGSRGLFVATTAVRGVRTIHLYTDSEDQNVTDIVQRWCREHPELSLKQSPDPTWRAIQRYLA